MAKVVVGFLLLGTFLGSLHGGAGENAAPTTGRPSNQLDQMNSEIEEMKSVISLLVRRTYDKDNRGDCYWKKVNHNVVPTGYLVPNAQTLQLCQEICERTTGCMYVEWTSCDRLCHLSKQPNAQRYERSCSATTSSPLSTIPTIPARKPVGNRKEASTTETSSRSPLTSETDDAIAMSTPETDTSERVSTPETDTSERVSTPETDTSERVSTPETDRPTSERVETSTLLPSTTSSPLSTIPTVPATTSSPLSTIPTVPAETSDVPTATSSPLSTIPTVPDRMSTTPSTLGDIC